MPPHIYLGFWGGAAIAVVVIAAIATSELRRIRKALER